MLRKKYQPFPSQIDNVLHISFKPCIRIYKSFRLDGRKEVRAYDSANINVKFISRIDSNKP